MPDRARIMVYGPSVGERSRDQLYGPVGNRLRQGDVALSPNLMARYFGWKPGQSYPIGREFVINGRRYRVGDVSYFSPNKPTFNTVEIWNGDPRTPDWGTVGIGGATGRASAPQPDDSEWTTSPGNTRFLPENSPDSQNVSDSSFENQWENDSAFFNWGDDEIGDAQGDAESGQPPGRGAVPQWEMPGTPPWDYGSGGMGRNDGYMQNFVNANLGSSINFPSYSDMRYGTRPPVSGGRVDYANTYNMTPGETVAGGAEPGTNWGTMTPDEIAEYQRTHDDAGNRTYGAAGTPAVNSSSNPSIIGTSTAMNASLGTPSNPMFGMSATTGARYFNTGSGWQPIGQAPQGIRDAANSGTGNYVSDQTAKGLLNTWNMYGANNTGNTGDAGHNIFNTGQGARFKGQMIDGVMTHVPVTYDTQRQFTAGQMGQGGPVLRATPEAHEAWNTALMQSPEYQRWQQVNNLMNSIPIDSGPQIFDNGPQILQDPKNP